MFNKRFTFLIIPLIFLLLSFFMHVTNARSQFFIDTRPQLPIIELNPSITGQLNLNQVQCSYNLPTPEIMITGTEDAIVSGQEITRYYISVINKSAYPDDLFASRPDLPPCGQNTNASRTWVNIYDGNGQYIYGFCSFSSAESLDDLWFSISKGQYPPSCVYIEIWDRACDQTYTSNCASTTINNAIINQELYFADAGESPGSVYHCDPATNTEHSIYTRPSKQICSFSFSPWDQNKIYFVNSNDYKIFVKNLSNTSSESVHFTYSTYIRDLAFNSKGELFFSESTGASNNGKIWQLNDDGSTSLFYTVALSAVDGFWSGDFTFDNEDNLYLSSGNRIPASLYSVDISSNTVTKIFTDTSESIAGMAFNKDGALYYANWGTKIYTFDLSNNNKNMVYANPQRTWLSDVSFPIPDEPSTNATGVWIMPYGVGNTRLDQIKSTGLTDYTDGLSSLFMEDAPFGGRLGFRLGYASSIPNSNIKYYRFQYKHVGETNWHDFQEPVYVHYVKEAVGQSPKFPTYMLGPREINGRNLYEFRPDESDLPSLVPTNPGETVSWPKTGFLGDIYNGFLNTEALHLVPGHHMIRLEIYDHAGNIVKPNLRGTFQFVVPIGVDSEGTILTTGADPSSIDAYGFEFPIYVDNRTCTAEIYEPTIGTETAGDCGFLRYNPAIPLNTPLVHISFKAAHPADFALFRFKLVRGHDTVSAATVHGYEVSDYTAGMYMQNTLGVFENEFSRAEILEPCVEGAFSENLYVYAKATTGWSQRINRFDASDIRAFALTPQESSTSAVNYTPPSSNTGIVQIPQVTTSPSTNIPVSTPVSPVINPTFSLPSLLGGVSRPVSSFSVNSLIPLTNTSTFGSSLGSFSSIGLISQNRSPLLFSF